MTRLGGRRGPRLHAGGLALLASSAFGQTVSDPGVDSVSLAPVRTFQIIPRLEIDETWTSNSRLATADPRADLITQISPGVRIVSRGGRVYGFLDYTASALAYARNTSSNRWQNALDARFSIEAIENRGFVDLSASISQQAASAYGTQSVDQSVVNGNRTEVRTYTLSPYLRGELGDAAQYEARVSHSAMRNSSDSAADNETNAASVQLGDSTPSRVVNWSAVASRQLIGFQDERTITDDRLRASISMRAASDLRVTAIAGRESNNYVTPEKESHTTPGIGLDWRPSERGNVSAEVQKRFFGKSHTVVADYRMPRSSISYVDTKEITTGVNQRGAAGIGTAYDLLFNQFASRQPDPLLRAGLVNDFLQTNGISPTARLLSGSLASAPTLQRQQHLALAWLGVRDTLTFSATSTSARRLDASAPALDDFAGGNEVRVRSVGVDLAHRLTPLSSVNLGWTLARALGDSATQSTRLRSLNLSWTTQLAIGAQLGVGVRRSLFDSPTQPYNESAALAYVRTTF